MSENYYSSETDEKKNQLGTYFDNISKALDSITEVCTIESWKCAKGSDLDAKFE